MCSGHFLERLPGPLYPHPECRLAVFDHLGLRIFRCAFARGMRSTRAALAATGHRSYRRRKSLTAGVVTVRSGLGATAEPRVNGHRVEPDLPIALVVLAKRQE